MSTPKPKWTDDLIKEAAELYGAGVKAEEVGLRLGGFSRNSVIGMMNRNGVQSPLCTSRKRNKRVPLNTAYVRSGKNKKRNMRRVVVAPLNIEMRKVPMLELKSKECRFAINDTSPLLFCGCETVPHTSWCAYHYNVVFKPARTDNF